MDRVEDLVQDGFVKIDNDAISQMIAENMSTIVHLLRISEDKLIRNENPIKIHDKVRQLMNENAYLRSKM